MKLYPSLILAMIAGRLVHGAVWAALFLVGGKAVTFASAFAFVIDGIPGTALQLLLIPLIVKAVENTRQWRRTERRRGMRSWKRRRQ